MSIKVISGVVCAMLALSASAQRPEPDRIPSVRGAITIQPVLHSTLVLSWNNRVIYVDPYGGANAFKGIDAPDIILITDIHGDHMNPETLNSIQTAKATIVAPHAVVELLPPSLRTRTVALKNGASTKIEGITISAVPMYNLPESADSRHPKGRGNGYVINLGGKRLYVSGDTEDIPEMHALRKIDVAFVCMNQPFTMTVEQAANVVLNFRPAIVYPFHYRGQGGLSDVEAFKKIIEAGNQKIEVRLRNWYPSY